MAAKAEVVRKSAGEIRLGSNPGGGTKFKMKIIIYNLFVESKYPGLHIFCKLDNKLIGLARDNNRISCHKQKLKCFLKKYGILITTQSANYASYHNFTLTDEFAFFNSLRDFKKTGQLAVIEDNTIDPENLVK